MTQTKLTESAIEDMAIKHLKSLGYRSRYVVDRLRRAQHAHALHRQTYERPQLDAGHCPR